MLQYLFFHSEGPNNLWLLFDASSNHCQINLTELLTSSETISTLVHAVLPILLLTSVVREPPCPWCAFRDCSCICAALFCSSHVRQQWLNAQFLFSYLRTEGSCLRRAGGLGCEELCTGLLLCGQKMHFIVKEQERFTSDACSRERQTKSSLLFMSVSFWPWRLKTSFWF